MSRSAAAGFLGRATYSSSYSSVRLRKELAIPTRSQVILTDYVQHPPGVYVQNLSAAWMVLPFFVAAAAIGLVCLLLEPL